MKIRVGINGFGRIGRLVARHLKARDNIDLVAINDLTSPEMLGYLFKHDSVHGLYPGTVEVDGRTITIDGDAMQVFAERDPAKLPWNELGVEYVFEATGLFRDRETAGAHLTAGAKKVLAELVRSLGYEVIDGGTHGADPVDYPDIAVAVAELVAGGRAARGILVDGAGIGSCMAANKVPGVRAALCYDEATAVNSREHNHANVLTLGAGLIGVNLARKIVTTWLETPAGGGRHQRRVDKITAIEHRFGGGR